MGNWEKITGTPYRVKPDLTRLFRGMVKYMNVHSEQICACSNCTRRVYKEGRCKKCYEAWKEMWEDFVRSGKFFTYFEQVPEKTEKH